MQLNCHYYSQNPRITARPHFTPDQDHRQQAGVFGPSHELSDPSVPDAAPLKEIGHKVERVVASQAPHTHRYAAAPSPSHIFPPRIPSGHIVARAEERIYPSHLPSPFSSHSTPHRVAIPTLERVSPTAPSPTSPLAYSPHTPRSFTPLQHTPPSASPSGMYESSGHYDTRQSPRIEASQLSRGGHSPSPSPRPPLLVQLHAVSPTRQSPYPVTASQQNLFDAFQLWENIIAPLKNAWKEHCRIYSVNSLDQSPYFESTDQMKLWLMYSCFFKALFSDKKATLLEINDKIHPMAVISSGLAHAATLKISVQFYEEGRHPPRPKF
jgi:hypothetical protein